MDEYTKLKLNQLDIAQESSIVVYSRERTGAVLGRKIRAEFGRVYISNEVKDCQKALSKIKNDCLDSAEHSKETSLYHSSQQMLWANRQIPIPESKRI